MSLAWQFILPLAILNMLVAGVWRFLPTGPLRWLICTTIIVIPFTLLARTLKKKKKFQTRTYAFIE